MNLGKKQQTEIPRIFISHAWEDKALVRQLEKALTEAGAEVWVDHAGIRGGDNLPERINEALEWCNTLLLVWSKQAKASHWVKLEWTNAISLRKLIIPCPIDGTPAPPIMANTAYIDFSDDKKGMRDLLRALRLAQTRAEEREADSELAGVIQAQLSQAAPPSIPKPPQGEPKSTPRKNKPSVSKPASPVRPTIIQLRPTAISDLSEAAVQKMLREKNFYDSSWNSSGKGIQHQYELVKRQDADLVIDHATGLTWQQGGSENCRPFKDAEAYIRQLKAQKHGGYNDWRLPTLEEAMSLMEPTKHGELYLNPIFDHKQWWVWTADKESAGRAWRVHFSHGYCFRNDFDYDNYVRAVRS